MKGSLVAALVRAAVCAGVLLLLVISAPGALPQSIAAERAARDSMPVKVANRTVIVLRGPIAGYSGSERAKSTMERIHALLEVEPHPQIAFEDAEEGKVTRVLLAGKLGFTVTPVDIDVNSGETTQIVAREAAKRLEQAIGEWREHGRPRYLVIAAALSAVATLVYGAVLWLLVHGNHWIGGRLSAAAAAQSQRLRVGGVRLLDAAHVLLFTRRTFTLVIWVLALALTSGWLTFVLEQFPFTRPWGEELEGNLLGLLKDVTLAIAGAMPGLLLVVVIFMIARAIVRMVAVFFDRVEKGRVDIKWLDADTVQPTRRIFNFVVLVFALAMAYPYLPGADTEAFKGLSVLVGLMVSLGGASVIGQAFNGLILMYTRAYRRGEYVRVGDNEGTIVDLSMFTTRLRTGMGEEITLPNSTVMAASIKNYSRAVDGTGYVVDTVVTIGYSTPWRQVEAMLLEAARRTPDIVSDPAPIVRQTALSDFYIEYRLAAYTPVETPARRIDVLNQLHGSIQDVFNEYGVQIMSPHYMMDPKEPQVVPKKDWHVAPARPPKAGDA
jgi:small-conductance mechanosensitive channel